MEVKTLVVKPPKVCLLISQLSTFHSNMFFKTLKHCWEFLRFWNIFGSFGILLNVFEDFGRLSKDDLALHSLGSNLRAEIKSPLVWFLSSTDQRGRDALSYKRTSWDPWHKRLSIFYKFSFHQFCNNIKLYMASVHNKKVNLNLFRN